MKAEPRRAWECAFVLMEDYRDRLTPRSYGLCLAALRRRPNKLSSKRAKRLHAVFAGLVEARQ
ncbi:hypothetical protein QE401_000513 [Pseudoroseomonas cervicalis]|nr:hypothetical protein [Pseudoroseomonas cervicalis]